MEDLVSLIEAAEVVYARRPAAADSRRRLDVADVADRSNRFAHAMRALVGTGPANVALLIGNRTEAVETDVGLVKGGLGRVSINPRLAADEVEYVIADSGARVLVVDPAYREAIDGRLDPSVTVLALDDSSPGGYESVMASASPTAARYARGADDASLVMYTSGTTGRPKGAVWTFSSRAAAVRNMLLNELDANAARTMAHVGSVSHGSGSKILPVYLRGGCSLLLERFEPQEFIEFVRENRVTATFVVPTMIQMLLDAAGPGDREALSTLIHTAYGGAKMPVALIQRAIDEFGDRFVQVYGSCEAPHPVLYLDRNDHATGNPTVLNSSGRPVIGVAVRFGEELALPVEGAEGELMVAGPHLFAGYLGAPTETEASFHHGYFRTGDIGRVVADGVVEIVGRAKEVIISGGYNVYPAEVERVLTEHPDVAQSCVYGVADDHWGEMVCAALVPVAGRQLVNEEVLSYCRERLAGYKRPQEVRVFDSLPLGSTNKVQRDEVRRLHDRNGRSGDV
ncbi:MAG: class I adenylate-forming enzyme family protein [Ilumatobacter sp.]|uniref:class I adenylate-forming enzyme family protein n=1 Tax=Ilumatobacter sp. TaxID=1967498 RepID=UPI00391CD10B